MQPQYKKFGAPYQKVWRSNNSEIFLLHALLVALNHALNHLATD